MHMNSELFLHVLTTFFSFYIVRNCVQQFIYVYAVLMFCYYAVVLISIAASTVTSFEILFCYNAMQMVLSSRESMSVKTYVQNLLQSAHNLRSQTNPSALH